jgi:hypothetical protein
MKPELGDPTLLPNAGIAPPAPPREEKDEKTEPEDYPLADFIEPVQWTWSKREAEIERALQEWTEQTHADY